MHELPRTEYPKVRPLFQNLAHSRALVFSLLEGNHTGRVFVDRMGDPRAAFLALACEFWYVAGDAGNTAFLQGLRRLALGELKPPGGHTFLFPPDEAWQRALQGLLADFKPMIIARREFDLDVERFAQPRGWKDRIPAGFRVQRYDRGLAQGVGLEEFWGSLDNFLARGFGFAALRGDEVVSRCHTVMVGDGRAEISIETAEPYRRRGLGALAARAFIEHGLAQGVQPVWSCWSTNTASVQMAEKLGFVARADMPVVYTIMEAQARESE
jgi:RimJ/RimL family protein N-acetyltransferase